MTPAPARTKEGPTPDDPLLANVSPMPMPPESETRPLVAGSNAFAFDLWPRLAKAPGNGAFSPASISIAFAMTGLGARGETSTQLRKVMHFQGSEDVVASGWGNLGRVMTTPPRYLKLRIANRLFGEKTYAFDAPFLEKTKTIFRAPLEPVDFKKEFEPARARINGWVEEQTEKRIVELLPPRSLDDTTRIVLVNAIYFLADWADPFDKRSTRDEPFFAAATAKKDVPTMHRTGRYPVAKADGVSVIELPYRGEEASMVVVLPNARDGLAAVEKGLSASRLEGWRKALAPANVEVALPRFEIRPPSISLGQELAALGMPLAFDSQKADLTGIAKAADPRERLYVAKVFHKAFVKVDEKGTEAAAATAVVVAKGGGAPAPATPFVVDHPFLYFIVEKTTGLVLFMGRVVDPAAT